LPNGEKLEAHSGLGDKRDDPQYIHVKMRGPTPPNVYDLTLREKLFHGVRAIRLNPVDDDKMFGRDGMLAHSYMLGSNGQSNGCVAFRDYPRFLQAFLSGKVDCPILASSLRAPPALIADMSVSMPIMIDSRRASVAVRAELRRATKSAANPNEEQSVHNSSLSITTAVHLTIHNRLTSNPSR
jgi:Tlde1 domain